MCKRFELPQAQIINTFRDFVDKIGRREPAALKPLINSYCMQVIPCSTAECERGFSHMNIIVSDTRSYLTIPHVSSLHVHQAAWTTKLNVDAYVLRSDMASQPQICNWRKDMYYSPQQYFGRGWLKSAVEICLTCNQCCVALLVTIYVSSWQWSIVICEYWIHRLAFCRLQLKRLILIFHIYFRLTIHDWGFSKRCNS